MELIRTNGKRDSRMKFTSPEFRFPFARTVNRPVCPWKWLKTFELTQTGNWTNKTVRYTRLSVERCSTVQVKEEKKAGEWGRNNLILSFWLIRYLKLNSGALDWATCYNCIQQYSLEKVTRKSWYSTLFFYDIFLNTVPELPINVIYVKRVRLWRSTFTFFEHFFPCIPFVGLLVKVPTWDDYSSTLGN